MYAVDGTQVIKGFDGEAIHANDASKKPITLGFLIVQALMASFPPSKENSKDSEDAARKIDDFELATRFHDASLPVHVSNSDHARIVSLVDKLPFGKMVVAQALVMLKRSPEVDPSAKGEKSSAPIPLAGNKRRAS